MSQVKARGMSAMPMIRFSLNDLDKSLWFSSSIRYHLYYFSDATLRALCRHSQTTKQQLQLFQVWDGRNCRMAMTLCKPTKLSGWKRSVKTRLTLKGAKRLLFSCDESLDPCWLDPETKTKVNGCFSSQQQALDILTVTINHEEGDKDKRTRRRFIKLSQEEVGGQKL